MSRFTSEDAPGTTPSPATRGRGGVPSVGLPHLPMHAECDVAAVVYGTEIDPDPLLRTFFETRLGEGLDVVGLLQERLALAEGPRRRCRLSLAGEVETAAPAELPAPSVEGDHRVLEAMGRRLAVTFDRRPDLLVLNRFGRREAGGGGLYSLLHDAVEAELPVLIAVPEALFPIWLACVRGLAVRLHPRREAIETWWRSVGFGPPPAARTAGACALWK